MQEIPLSEQGKKEISSQSLTLSILLFVIFVGTCLAEAFMLTAAMPNFLKILAGIGIAGVFMIPGVMIGRALLDLRKDLKKGVMLRNTGKVEKKEREMLTNQTHTHRLFILGEKILVDQDQYNAVEEGQEIAYYVLPLSEVIVSVAPAAE